MTFGATVPTAVLILDSDLLALRQLGPWLKAMVDSSPDYGCPDRAESLELAVHEICCNVVEHAYSQQDGIIVVSGWVLPDRTEIRISDTGAPYVASVKHWLQSASDPAHIRGYGLLIAGKLVDELSYDRDRSVNIWRLEVLHSESCSEVSS